MKLLLTLLFTALCIGGCRVNGDPTSPGAIAFYACVLGIIACLITAEIFLRWLASTEEDSERDARGTHKDGAPRCLRCNRRLSLITSSPTDRFCHGCEAHMQTPFQSQHTTKKDPK